MNLVQLVENMLERPSLLLRKDCGEQDGILGKGNRFLALQLHISICTINCSKPAWKNWGEDRLKQLGRFMAAMHSNGS